MKLSKRLQQINDLAVPSFQADNTSYDHIWDCCCDHGLLGFSLLSYTTSQSSISKVHFVDIVPELMQKIEVKLHRFYANSDDKNSKDNQQWQVHCLDVAKLPLNNYAGKHLVIIAGIGGDLMIKFIEEINQQYKHLTIDYLLCPVHHQYALREKLIALDFSLKDEVLVEDNQRFYEILLLSSLSPASISTTAQTSNSIEGKVCAVGDKIWRFESNEQADITKRYLTKTLNHYLRMQQGLQKREQESLSKRTTSKETVFEKTLEKSVLEKEMAETTKNNLRDVQRIISDYRTVKL
ncbi:tRNA (adenine(22)-N(1))-methyltransferase [Colwellia echini]|uniref:tRNA (adenine(22)-N(1))-methyltransferase n=1 Tax=Colwellia echini TaxID=1982103 RepID=UPI001FE9F053|nr:tRNA (adenine(22)-N(1))-methyltransferase TrmK [Colwellia echini]